MKIVKPYAHIIAPIDVSSMAKIEWCARISHRAEDKQTEGSWKRFLQSVVLDHGDWSVVEHVSVSVDALVDRGITHEWVRHRLASYTQESTRFVNYEKKMAPSFIYPNPDVSCPNCLFNHNEPTLSGIHSISGDHSQCLYDKDWLWLIGNAEGTYKALLTRGWRPQEARSVFPNALASRIITSANLRQWRHFFIMRTTAEAHPQMREVTIPLLKEFQTCFPLLFDDIEPMAKQSEAMKKMR